MNLLLSTLAYTTINDLHWEVKVTALDFWKMLIEKQLHCKNLGVKCKADILEEMALNGIFGILLECLKEDSDVICIQKTVEVIKELLKIFDESDLVTKDDTYLKARAKSSSNIPEETLQKSTICSNTESIDNDEIIESICTENDLNLLSKMTLEKKNLKIVDDMFYKQFCIVKANDFLSKISTINLDDLVDNRSDWIMENNSFSSLLDDMMYSLQINDVNNIECY